MNSNIMVSVICNTYNHEKYIRDALEGFVMQKTTFPFEVLVHDDASTDRTADIIREYEEKYPDIIKPIYQTENQYSKHDGTIGRLQKNRVQGKYVAFCEGDDYWTDPLKLQRQYDALERERDCSICVHTVQEIQEDGLATNQYRPASQMKAGIINAQHFLNIRMKYPFQTASYFLRSSLWFELVDNPPAFRKAADVGDEPLLLYMIVCGGIYYIPECMAVYRTLSEGSWSAREKYDAERLKVHSRKMYEMMCLFDDYTGHRYNCHLDYLRGSMLWKQENYRELLKKQNLQYVKQQGFLKRVFIYVGAIFPVTSKLRRFRWQLRKK